MKHLRRAATYSVVVVFFALLCANRAAHQDAVLAVTSGMGAGLFLAFVVGCVVIHFEERSARLAREEAL